MKKFIMCLMFLCLIMTNTYADRIETEVIEFQNNISTTDSNKTNDFSARKTLVRTNITDSTEAISLNYFTNRFSPIENRTSIWNQGAVDATFSTNWISTNILGLRIGSIESNTSKWNTASTDATFSTNWIATSGVVTDGMTLVTGLYGPNPIGTNQYANKSYVDSLISGLSHLYFTTNRNAQFNLGTTNYWGSDIAPLTIATNVVTVTSNGQYFFTFIGTQGVTRIEGGAVEVNAVIFELASGSLSAQPELYFTDVNSNLYESASPNAQAVPSSKPTSFQEWIINAENHDFGGVTNYPMIRWKSSNVSGSPVVRIATGGGEASHAALPIFTINTVDSRVDSILAQTTKWNTASTDATFSTNWIATNTFGSRITSLESRTDTWNTASTDATFSTNWIATNTFGSRITSLESRTDTWNTASIDATFSTNWITTNSLGSRMTTLETNTVALNNRYTTAASTLDDWNLISETFSRKMLLRVDGRELTNGIEGTGLWMDLWTNNVTVTGTIYYATNLSGIGAVSIGSVTCVNSYASFTVLPNTVIPTNRAVYIDLPVNPPVSSGHIKFEAKIR